MASKSVATIIEEKDLPPPSKTLPKSQSDNGRTSARMRKPASIPPKKETKHNESDTSSSSDDSVPHINPLETNSSPSRQVPVQAIVPPPQPIVQPPLQPIIQPPLQPIIQAPPVAPAPVNDFDPKPFLDLLKEIIDTDREEMKKHGEHSRKIQIELIEIIKKMQQSK